MLAINISDVLNILNLCKPYLIFFGVVFVVAILTIILCKKMPKAKKYMLRAQSVVAIILALVITINLICFGPMSTIISLATGTGVIKEETTEAAKDLVDQIADEGIVLLANEAGTLPLADTDKLNVFGWASTNPCYGGTGSGALSMSYPVVSLTEGLEDAGYKLNSDLYDFYTEYREDRPEVGMWAQDWTLPEPPAKTYSTELLDEAKAFSDKAVIVITRVGGEGADLPMDLDQVTYEDNSKEYKDFEPGHHYLELSQTERDMVDLVTQNFDDVILIYNGANAFELGFTEEYEQIKSVIWCPGTGQTGFDSLGSIISGDVNPSGKTSDTFVYDLTTTPYYNNIGDFTYDNMDEFEAEVFDYHVKPKFVNYVEGIYVGYRFYETAAQEGLIQYDEVVNYPFGYGLSYTEFTQEMSDIQADASGNLTVDVTVTNTGDAAGKDVVQVYYNPPYTNGGIEKASANLVAFDKTEILEPGESETLTITFAQEDMASYDSYGSGSYVLEAGDYNISIQQDSHTVITGQIYHVDEDIVYGADNARATDETAAVNQFQDAEGDVTYLTRKDGFANYAEATAAPVNFSISEEDKADFTNLSNYDPKDLNDTNDKMPVTGANNGMVLGDMRGKPYDDPDWEPLLDQLKISEMKELIAQAGFQTLPIKSVDKYATVDCDGPASINNNFTGAGSIGFPSAVMLASTWNEDLALEFGRSIGEMADQMDVSGWYAPAMNIHRSAFAGRNFEYYSEDGFLSGKMAAGAVAGAREFGVYAYLKHFALNDQEDNRKHMLCTWSNEQSIREIYLKPFELAVKEGQAQAIMSAFNYIGTTWAGASSSLLNSVLRDEWGFEGFVLTDYFDVCGYMNADQAIRNGNDACLVNYDAGSNYLVDTESATSVTAMRQASKNIMFTVVNSRAYDSDAKGGGLQNWQIMLIVADIALFVGLAAVEILVVRKGYAKRKNEI